MSNAHKCDDCGKYWDGKSMIRNRPKGEIQLNNCTAKFEIIGGINSVWDDGDLCDGCYMKALREFMDTCVAKKGGQIR